MLSENQILRYSRQLILKDIGYEGQEKLLKSRVLVIGAGGLGSPVLYYLAACGIGTLGIADFDTVSISNLQRQILHHTEDIGRKKTDSAGEKLKKINPDTDIIKHNSRVGIDNIEDLISQYDVIIDAVDNFPARYLITDACFFHRKPVIEGAVLGFEGLLTTILPGNSHCYRCLYPYPPEDGMVPTCSDTGIMGMITGTIGSLQALEAIKVLLGIGEILVNRLLTFDGLSLGFRTINLPKRKNCPLCGEYPKIRELNLYELKCRIKSIDE